MSIRSFILPLAVVGLLGPLASPVEAQSYSPRGQDTYIDIGIFYDDLDPYGDWVEMPDYGWGFAPRVDRDWRPYTRGQWIWTDYGWYWDSDEDFGWAAYHYGRWVNDRYYGWIWIPGTEWAPAWVSWRHGNGYSGWAPLPPRAIWRARIGFNIGGLEIDAYLGARDYNFVSDRRFVDRGLYQYVVPPTQNITIINVTNNVTNYTVVDERIVNSGIALATVEQAVGRSVPRARTIEVARPDARNRPSSGEISIYRPSVRAAPGKRPAQGRSLVKGEAPPPLLVERRKQRDQERQQSGNEVDRSAKDAAQRQPAARPRDNNQGERAPASPPAPRIQPPQPERQPQRDQEKARQDEAAAQRARDQDQQRKARPRPEPTRLQAEPQPPRQDERARQQQEAQQQQAQQQQAQQQQRDQARQNADKQRVQDQDRQRADQAKQQANDQQQRDQQRADQAKQQANDQQQRDQQRADQAKQQADKRAKDAPAPAKDDPKNKAKKDPKVKPTPGPA